MGRLGFAGVLLGCGLLVGCEQPVDRFCCLSLTAESCLDPRLEADISAPIPCTDPGAPYCDEAGDYGAAHTCIPTPSCDGPSDCPAERPFCIEHSCVECDGDESCPASAPVCGDNLDCESCIEDAECADRIDTPHCLEESGACVTCAEVCPDPAASVCDGEACRGCQAHGECASEVCDRATGACVDPADIIYVDAAGPGGASCSQTNTCSTIADGFARLSGTRNIIKIRPGTYNEEIDVSSSDTTVTIIGDGATVQAAALNEPVVNVAYADVTIEGLTLTGAGGGSGPPGVACALGTLRLERSKVIANHAGIFIGNCQFSLVNNMILMNGTASSQFGGVQISNITTAGLRTIEFNTIAQNGNSGTVSVGTGIDCVGVTTPLTFSNNIIYGNQVGSGDAQVAGANCGYAYSDIGPDGVSGTGNLNVDPQYVDPDNATPLLRDFHLLAGSPARDAADPAADLGLDFDEESRDDARRDMGADEVTP
jgi:hypothetical protein